MKNTFLRILALSALVIASFPIISLSQPCNAPISGGNAIASSTAVCPGTSLYISVNGSSTGTGLSYQWQSSPDNVNWTDIAGATNVDYPASPFVSTYYRRYILCNSGGTAWSTGVLVTVKDFNTCYCTPSPSNCNIGYSITNVSFGSLNNTSGCSTTGYTNYTSTVAAPAITQGDYLPISVTINFGSWRRVHTYIDFNQDGKFGSNEYVKLKNPPSGNLYTGFIKVPFGAKTGLTRMRVVVDDQDVNSPCSSRTGSETEDYSINILPNISGAKGYVLYVNLLATGNNTGMTWSNALTSIEQALDLATPGDTIKVAEGIYQVDYAHADGIKLKDSIVVLGGYPLSGNPTDADRNYSQHKVVVNGTGRRHVVLASGPMTATTIDGLILQNGGASGNPGSQSRGGGLSIENGANILIRNCVFLKNTYTLNGAAIAIDRADPEFVNCIVEQNKGFNSTILVQNYSRPLFQNTLVARNKSSELFHIDSSLISFVNCSIADNLQNKTIIASNLSQVSLKNCILYYNPAAGIGSQRVYDNDEIMLDNSTASTDHCLLQNYALGSNLLLGYQPKFRDTASVAGPDTLYFTGDDGYTLINPCSAAINAGDNTAVIGISSDLTGRPRIFQSTVDLGPYESQQNLGSIPSVVFVNAAATGLNDGSSWANAFTDPLAALRTCSDTIKIAAGTYAPYKVSDEPYWLENRRVVMGGYPSTGSPTEADRNYSLYPTIISGLTLNSSVSTAMRGLHMDSTSAIDGLTFSNVRRDLTNNEFGALAYTESNNPVIRNCTFTANASRSFYINNNINPVLQNCTFINNDHTQDESATEIVLIENTQTCTITGCSFINNRLDIHGSIQSYYGKIIQMNYTSPVFNGCTFTKNTGTVIENYYSHPAFSNTQFLNNYAMDSTTDVRNVYSNPTFSNCIFMDTASSISYTPLRGGIIKNLRSNPVFSNCRFHNGRASRAGGVAYNDSSQAVFQQCVFIDCQNVFYNTGKSNIVVENCISSGCRTNNYVLATFIQNDNSSPTLTNTSVVNGIGNFGNTTIPYVNPLIYNTNGSQPAIANCIFWKNFNIPPQTAVSSFTMFQYRNEIYNNGTSQPVIKNSFFEFYDAGAANNNVKALEPRFVDYTNLIGEDGIWFTADDGLRLCSCSPAINSGSNLAATSSTDIAGNSRISAGTVDVGAYEFNGNPVIPSSRTAYVNAAATGGNSGTDWNNAYTELYTAIKNSCLDTIKVAKGIYKPSVTGRDQSLKVTRSLTILGSYDPANPNDTSRFPDVLPTVISGDVGIAGDTSDNSVALLRAKYIDSLKIDGLVFRDANDYSGKYADNGALYAYYLSNLSIKNTRFYDNFGNYYGGALDARVIRKLDLQQTVFSGNKAISGAGMYIEGTDDTIRISNCIFDKNVASSVGGAVNFEFATKLSVKNTLVNNNVAGQGAGFEFSGSSYGSIHNCTFSNNKNTSSNYGAGIDFYNSNAAAIANSIFTGNSRNTQTTQSAWQDVYYYNTKPAGSALDLDLRYSAMSTSPSINRGGMISPTGIIYKNAADARGSDGKWFTNDDGLQLSKCSNGIDKGQNSLASAVDLSNNKRIFGSTIDMGAYEFSGTPEWTRLLDTPNDSLIANKEFTDANGWTHYFKDCYYLMSIKKYGQNIGTIGDGTFSVKIKTTPAYGSGAATDLSAATYVTPGVSWKVMNRYWKVTPTSQPTDSIQVKFPFTQADFNDVKGSNPSFTTPEQMVFYKVDGQYDALDLNVPAASFHQYFHGPVPSTFNWVISSTDTIFQANYFINSFSGGGGGGGTGIGGGALPVNFVKVNAVNGKRFINVRWEVRNQVNIRHYIIERSTNGRVFSTMGKVNATPAISYSFADNDVLENISYFYRVKAVDINGKQTYSQVVSAAIVDPSGISISISPNPASNSILIKMNNGNNSVAIVSIISSSGYTCLKQQVIFDRSDGCTKIDVAALPSGVYTVMVRSGEYVYQKKLVIVK